MTILDLSDSYARLGWMNRLGGRAQRLASASMREIIDHGLEREEKVIGRFRYLRFWLGGAVPDDLGFLLADFAFNGRSCLDMAMQSVVNAHSLAWRRPEFPLVDDVSLAPDASRSWAMAQKVLPPPHLEAVKGMQPRPSAYGGDIPVNLTGIELRTLANVNKHQNLTPVVARDIMRGISGGKEVRLVRGKPWPEAGDSIMVLRGSAEMSAAEMVAVANPTTALVLEVSGPELGFTIPDLQYGGQSFRLAIKVDDFLVRASKFVALALKRLEQADKWYRERGAGIPVMDVDGTL